MIHGEKCGKKLKIKRSWGLEGTKGVTMGLSRERGLQAKSLSISCLSCLSHSISSY